MTDKEQYICLNCYAVGSLTTAGRCSTCDSDAVASTERVVASLHADPTAFKHTTRIIPILTWYHIKLGCFETVVPYTRASSLEDALEYAKGPMCEWYLVKQPSCNFTPETQLLDHNGFNQWCRKRWLLDSVSNDKTKESEENSEHKATS